MDAPSLYSNSYQVINFYPVNKTFELWISPMCSENNVPTPNGTNLYLSLLSLQGDDNVPPCLDDSCQYSNY
jgi:hypothetical protein